MARAKTILVLLDAFVLRADLSWRRGRATVTELRRVARGRRELAVAIGDLTEQQALRGPVLVLADEVFLQSIELPPRAIAGLDRRALHSAIALEAQSFSGLAGETVTEWWRRGDQRSFVVAQVGRGEFAAVVEAVGRVGGSLIGLAHPAAVPLGFDDGPFTRREDWGSLRAHVRGDDGGATRIDVRRGTLAGQDDEACTEHLVVGANAPELPAARRLDLADDTVAGAWLERWAEAFAAADGVVALVPPPSPSERHRRILLGAVAVAAVVAAGVLDRFGVQTEVFAATRELAAARAPIERLRAAEAEADVLQAQLAAVRAPLPAAAPPAVLWSPTTLVALLEALAAARPDGVLLDECELGFRRCVVHGRTAEPAAVDRWTNALVPLVGRFGYSVLPGARQVLPPEAGALFGFAVELVPIAAPEPPPVTEEMR